jgi:hypothetical protein
LYEKTSNHLKYYGEKPHTVAGGLIFTLTVDTVAHDSQAQIHPAREEAKISDPDSIP